MNCPAKALYIEGENTCGKEIEEVTVDRLVEGKPVGYRKCKDTRAQGVGAGEKGVGGRGCGGSVCSW